MKAFKFTGVEKVSIIIVLINILLLMVFGFTFGIFIVFMMSTVILLWFGLRKYKEKKDSKIVTAVYKVFTYGIITWIISIVVIITCVVSSIRYDVTRNDYDYIVVLGAGLRGDRISLILEKRLEKAVELSSVMSDTKIIVSGGKGDDELISEAEAMRRYLVNHGVDESRIVMEDKSTSTAENFDYSYQILDKIGNGDEQILVITSDFHMFRSLRLARKKGRGVDGVASETPMFIYMNYLSREYFAVIKSEMFD